MSGKTEAAHRPKTTLISVFIEASPLIAGPLLFFSGAFRLLSAALPQLSDRLDSLSRWVPLGVIEFSHLAGSLVGTLMLFVAFGVMRRLAPARIIALCLSLAGAGFAWLHGASYFESIYLLLLAGLFSIAPSAYWRQSRLSALRPNLQWALVAGLAVILAGWVGLIAYGTIPYSDELWWRFVLDGDVSRYLRASLLVVLTVIILSTWAMIQPKRPSGYDVDDRKALADWLAAAGEAKPVSRLSLMGDKLAFASEDGRARIFFAVQGDCWIAMGGPAGDPSGFSDLLWSFRMEADRHNAWAALYAIEESELALALENGFTVQKVGEAAIIKLADFTLEGGSRSSLRQIMRKAEKAAMEFEVLDRFPVSGDLKDEMKAVSDRWLLTHGGHEKSFSLGRYDADFLGALPVALVRHEGKVVAFVTLLDDPTGRRLSVDLMRHADAPPQTMEWLFLQLALWGKAANWKELDLGMAPLSGLKSRRFSPMFTRLGALVFSHGEEFYGFEGLRQFKSKFRPDWRPVYLASPPGMRVYSTMLNVALLTSGGWRAMLFPKAPPRRDADPG